MMTSTAQSSKIILEHTQALSSASTGFKAAADWLHATLFPAAILGITFFDAVNDFIHLGQALLVVLGVVYSTLQIKKILMEIRKKEKRKIITPDETSFTDRHP